MIWTRMLPPAGDFLLSLSAMAEMGDFPARISRLVSQAEIAAGNGDYAAALELVKRAYILHSFIPDSEKDGMQMQFRRIEELLEKLEKWASEGEPSGTLQKIPVTFANPIGPDEFCTRDDRY